MSSIETQLFRSRDSRLLKNTITFDYKGDFEQMIISFQCGEKVLDIYSTSAGRINAVEKQVEIPNLQPLEIYTEYGEMSSKVDCLIGYYHQRELQHYEALSATFESGKQIVESAIEVPVIATVPESFSGKFRDFQEKLHRGMSLWKIEMSSTDNIGLTIKTTATEFSLFCFGEFSEEVLASDYIFPLDPKLTHLTIPREILEKKYSQYNPGCKIGIFELVKPDFVGVTDLYFKTLVSNTLSLGDFAK